MPPPRSHRPSTPTMNGTPGGDHRRPARRRDDPSGHPVVTCDIPRPDRAAHAAGRRLSLSGLLVEPAQPSSMASSGCCTRWASWSRGRNRSISKKFGTPEWSSRGFCNSCPRDSMLVIGDEIIETPMAWPCRYFETFSYRPLLKDYFRRGARWSAAPKPQLVDALYDRDYRIPEKGEPISYSSPSSSRCSTPPISSAAAAISSSRAAM